MDMVLVIGRSGPLIEYRAWILGALVPFAALYTWQALKKKNFNIFSN